MKKNLLISVFIAFIITNGSAFAAGDVGQCVYPKTKLVKKNQLDFKNPVYIYKTPNSTEMQMLKVLSAFIVKAEVNGFIQLVTVPDYDLPDPNKDSGKVIGWAKRSDFELQDLRNCT